MKIFPVNSYNLNEKKSVLSQLKETKPETDVSKYECTKCPVAYSKAFLVSFGARVDKGLKRFAESNEEVMPKTVSDYIKLLSEDVSMTPVEAHREAFSMLELANSVEEIKDVFPDEPLFQNLISTKDSKARVGLIHDINVMRDVFNETSTPPVKTGEELSVYLVKKVFLENKTIGEINEDLDKDLDDVFKKEDKKYVGYSTLDALGIKYPETSYLTSLRYTQEGYSDKIGEKLSKSLSDFYKNMTPEQRTERNSKSLKNIEKWWSELSDEDKMALLTEKSSEIAFLKSFEKVKKSSSSKPSEKPETSQDKNDVNQPHSATRSEKVKTSLSEDPLFIQWATLNLEAYKASLSPEELAELSEKKSLRMASMWTSFSPDEKTDYISKMFIGSEKQKVAMIDAWNNSPEIRQDLSSFLKAKNLYRPEGLMYRTQEYSEAQSKVMKEFWETYPQHGEKLGEEISAAYARVSKAFANGTFDALRQEVLDAQSAAKQELRSKKNNNSHKSDIFRAFSKTVTTVYGALPDEFVQVYIKDAEDLDDTTLSEWTRLLQGKQNQVSQDTMNVLASKETKYPTQKIAITQALAEVLFEASGDKALLSMNFKQLMGMYMNTLKYKQRPIVLTTINSAIRKEINIEIKGNVSPKDLKQVYDRYSKPLNDQELDQAMSALELKEMDNLYAPARERVAKFGVFAKDILFPADNLNLLDLTTLEAKKDVFMDGVNDKNLKEFFNNRLTKSLIKATKQVMKDSCPFIPIEYSTKKVDDVLVKVSSSLGEDLKNIIKSNLSDDYMLFSLNHMLFQLTNNDSVFDFDYSQALTMLTDIYKNNKKVGDFVQSNQNGTNTMLPIAFAPDFDSISKTYNSLMEPPSIASKDFAVAKDFISLYSDRAKPLGAEYNEYFNILYRNIMIYLYVVPVSEEQRHKIVSKFYHNYVGCVNDNIS